MNKFKRLSLLLCCLLMFCVGFLSTNNSLTAYAYNEEENFYPIDFKLARLIIKDANETQLYAEAQTPNSDNRYLFNNGDISNINYMGVYNYSPNNTFTFPYNSEGYDYYILGAVVSSVVDVQKSTFKPTQIQVHGFDSVANNYYTYPITETNVYNIDTKYSKGFGFSSKIGFDYRGNIGIESILMINDKDGSGNKPAKLEIEFGILAVPKNGSELDVQQSILNQLKQMESSITENIQNGANSISSAVGQSAEKVSGAINDAKEELKEKLDEIYEMEENDDLGVNDIQSQVEEKLGVLNFTADTLSSFLDLFNSSTVADAKITFPGYTIEVQGQTYTVWNNIEFDFAFLEENFGILINACRTVTVLCVWLAVLSYLGKAKDQIIINRG